MIWVPDERTLFDKLLPATFDGRSQFHEKRPGRRSAEERDELAPLHSITSDECGWHVETDRLGCLYVDDELEIRARLGDTR